MNEYRIGYIKWIDTLNRIESVIDRLIERWDEYMILVMNIYIINKKWNRNLRIRNMTNWYTMWTRITCWIW